MTPSHAPAPAASAHPGPDGTSVEFSGVRRVYGATSALDGLDLAIAPGELLALLGPSGCGKTTALRILAGFDVPTSGRVLVDGAEVTGIPANRRRMGMVFQSYSLFPTMSALDNVGYGLQVRRTPAGARRRRAGELLELVGLAEHVHKFPHQMSGGQQQRVALARALALTPRVLLLDEPLSALDAKVREQLRDEIRRIQLQMGVTTVFVTHDQEEALSMADRVAVLNGGRLEQCASPAELYERPATAFVAAFVGTMNRLPGTLQDSGTVRVGRQVLPVTPSAAAGQGAGSPVDVLVRPEALDLVADDASDSYVSVSTFRGSSVRLRVVTADAGELLADVAPHRAASLTPGSRVAWRLPERPVLVATATAGSAQDASATAREVSTVS